MSIISKRRVTTISGADYEDDTLPRGTKVRLTTGEAQVFNERISIGCNNIPVDVFKAANGVVGEPHKVVVDASCDCDDCNLPVYQVQADAYVVRAGHIKMTGHHAWSVDDIQEYVTTITVLEEAPSPPTFREVTATKGLYFCHTHTRHFWAFGAGYNHEPMWTEIDAATLQFRGQFPDPDWDCDLRVHLSLSSIDWNQGHAQQLRTTLTDRQAGRMYG